MSQGGFALSKGFLLLQEDGAPSIGSWFAVNTPATGPTERLTARMEPNNPGPGSAHDLGITGVKGVIIGGQHPLLVSEAYWKEASLINPLQQLEDAYQHRAFSVVLASHDEVLNGQQNQMAKMFRAIDPDRVHVIEGANHQLTRHRSKVVNLIIGQLALPRG